MYVNTMIVLFHTIWHAIAELLLPSWPKEVRDITCEAIQAMEKEKKSVVLNTKRDFTLV